MPPQKRDPWFKEHSAGDPRLRLCSLEARGVHAEGRRLMHAFGQPYGHLALQEGVSWPLSKLARMLNVTQKQLQTAIEELLEAAVWVRENGIVADPDLVGQMEIILRKRMAGKAGGNPLLKQAANGLLKQEVKQPNAGLLNQPGEPPQFYARAGASLSLSSSSSSSEGECEGEPPHIPTLSEFLACAEFAAKGVPEDYLRGKFAWFEGNNAWLDQHKRLKKYAVLVCSWWETDRVAWLAKKKAEPGDLVELRARLTVEKDPEKRAKLREDLKRLEG